MFAKNVATTLIVATFFECFEKREQTLEWRCISKIYSEAPSIVSLEMCIAVAWTFFKTLNIVIANGT